MYGGTGRDGSPKFLYVGESEDWGGPAPGHGRQSGLVRPGDRGSRDPRGRESFSSNDPRCQRNLT